MLIASWNVNSIKSRLAHVTDWLQEHRPDVLMLQELKTPDFPVQAFADIGYHAEYVGQKSYNGVAIVSKQPVAVLARALPGDDTDTQARYLEVEADGLRLVNIYLPNGNPLGTPKFDYKLAWMDRLRDRMADLKAEGVPAIIGGDYNVIPEELDAAKPKNWVKNALFQPEPRARYRGLLELGYIDAFRYFNPEGGHYTFWEYFRDSFARNSGIRIDHFLVASELEDRLAGCMIDTVPREREHSSDHTVIALAVR